MTARERENSRALLWQPSPEAVRDSRMAGFARWVEESRGLSLSGFTSLHEWSISDLDGFWGAVWEHFDIVASAQGECALRAHTMPGAEWLSLIHI